MIHFVSYNKRNFINNRLQMTQARTQPLSPADLTDEQRDFLKPFTDREGRFPNVFGTLVQHMDLVRAWSEFGLYTLRGNQLDPVLREVLILRTAVLIGSDYEWHQHRKIAIRLGMSDDIIEQVKNGKQTSEPDIDLLIQTANELIADHRLADDTWKRLMSRFDLTYVLDVIFTVGAYTALGMALNSCDVQVEDQ